MNIERRGWNRNQKFTLSGSETRTTFNPCIAIVSAILLPIPVPAPVTNAHFALYFFFKLTGPQ